MRRSLVIVVAVGLAWGCAGFGTAAGRLGRAGQGLGRGPGAGGGGAAAPRGRGDRRGAEAAPPCHRARSRRPRAGRGVRAGSRRRRHVRGRDQGVQEDRRRPEPQRGGRLRHAAGPGGADPRGARSRHQTPAHGGGCGPPGWPGPAGARAVSDSGRQGARRRGSTCATCSTSGRTTRGCGSSPASRCARWASWTRPRTGSGAPRRCPSCANGPRSSLVDTLATAQKFKEAADVLGEFLSKEGSTLTGMTRWATLLARSGDKDKARQVLDQVLAGDPNQHGALLLKAMVEASDGHVEVAEQLYRKAAGGQPGRPGRGSRPGAAADRQPAPGRGARRPGRPLEADRGEASWTANTRPPKWRRSASHSSSSTARPTMRCRGSRGPAARC